MADNVDIYEGGTEPRFGQLFKLMFEVVEDGLSRMTNQEYARTVRDRINKTAAQLRITMDANTRSITIYIDEPGTPGQWERIFTLAIDNPDVPRTVH